MILPPERLALSPLERRQHRRSLPADAYDEAQREWSEAETTTPFGIASALDALLANRDTYEMEDDVANWLRLLSDAARALA